MTCPRLLAMFLAIIMLLIGVGCSRQDTDERLVGYIEAEYVYVASAQPGWVVSMSHSEGDFVAAGDVLFELDKGEQNALYAEAAARVAQADAQARDIATGARPAEISALEAQYQEASARFSLAKAEMDRSLPLVAEGIEAKVLGDQLIANYKAAAARVRSAEQAIEIARLAGRTATRDAADASKATADATLAQAEWHLNQRTVTAKTDGRVDFVFHRQGEYVVAGTPVVALLPPDSLKVKFFVPQSELTRLKTGNTVRVRTDGVAQDIDARVVYIADEAEFTPPVIYSAGSREKLVFLVEARLPEGTGLRPGLPVDVILQ